jgi:hypothetical protein
MKKKKKTSSIKSFKTDVETICRNAEYKECFLCGSHKPIKSHSIQEKVLRSLTSKDKGKVISRKYNLRNNINTFDEIGLAQASTFNGFCGKHDKELFQCIEDQQYEGSSQQKFMYAYRNFAIEYYKKQKNKVMIDGLSNYYLTGGHLEISGEELSSNKDFADEQVEVMKVIQTDLNQILNDSEFEKIYTVEIKFDQNLNSLASTIYSPEFNFSGERINNPYTKSHSLDFISLTLTINDNKSILLLSCRSDNEKLISYINSFATLETNQLMRFLSGIILYHCENIFFSIKAWSSLDEKDRSFMDNTFKESMLFRDLKPHLYTGVNFLELFSSIPK